MYVDFFQNLIPLSYNYDLVSQWQNCATVDSYAFPVPSRDRFYGMLGQTVVTKSFIIRRIIITSSVDSKTYE